MKLLKVLALFLGVFASGTLFVFSNISDNYPVDDACSKIRTFGAQHNRYPTLDELDVLGIPDAKLFSTREYRTKGAIFSSISAKTSCRHAKSVPRMKGRIGTKFEITPYEHEGRKRVLG